MRFLGIDLGWTSGATGLCCLELESDRLKLRQLAWRVDLDEILAWVDEWLPSPEPGMIAVDAPTLIPNATGMRTCDRLMHQRFGRYHAGCYPANLGCAFAPRTVGFGLSLEFRGFAHAPVIQPQVLGRYQIEVFPHAAMVALFNLERILKYKKGRLADRRQGLLCLRRLLLDHLPRLDPSLDLPELPPIPNRGAALKALEDQLDALVCAYVAAYWWMWGTQRSWVLGGDSAADSDPSLAKSTSRQFLATGYIVVPQLKQRPQRQLRNVTLHCSSSAR